MKNMIGLEIITKLLNYKNCDLVTKNTIKV